MAELSETGSDTGLHCHPPVVVSESASTAQGGAPDKQEPRSDLRKGGMTPRK